MRTLLSLLPLFLTGSLLAAAESGGGSTAPVERVFDPDGIEEVQVGEGLSDSTKATTTNLCSNLQALSKRTATFKDSNGVAHSFSVTVGGGDPWKGGESVCLGRCGGACNYFITGLPSGRNTYTQACLNHDVCYSYQDEFFSGFGRGRCDIQFLGQAKTDYSNSANCYGNLTPYTPPGWSNKIVMSKVIGTNTDAASFSTSDTIYVDVAFANFGSYRIPNRFSVTLRIIDDLTGWVKTYPFTKYGQSNNTYSWWSDINIGKLPAGTHTAQLRVDLGGDAVESNESDNLFSRKIVVGNSNQANGLCYIDETCSAGNLYKVRDSGSNQCVSLSSCLELWKCAAGPTTRTCGGGSTCCAFSPGCSGDVQTCSPGYCTSLSTCQDRIAF